MVHTANLLQFLVIFIITFGNKIQAQRHFYHFEDDDYPFFGDYDYGRRPVSTVGCGNDTSFTGASGTITSPNYPNSYPDSLHCSYTIEVENGNSANITFEDFVTENRHDWVQMNCSIGSNPFVSPHFSGRTVPPFMSFGSCRQITVVFHSDGSASYKGFSLNYAIGQGLSGGIITGPRNVFVKAFDNVYPIRQIVLSCESSVSLNGSYPWWSRDDGHSIRQLTNSKCEFVDRQEHYWLYEEYYSSYERREQVSPSSKSRGPTSSACNITVVGDPGIYTCTDSSLSSASAMVSILHFSVSTDRDNNQREIVADDNITISCDHRNTWYQPSTLRPNLSTYFSSAQQDYIPRSAGSSLQVSTITVRASPEWLPSYFCHFNFSLPDNFPNNMATNLPDDFSLGTEPREVLFWPERDAMTVIGALNGKMEQDGVLTCHVPANPTPKYRWLDVASGKSSAGPTVHVLHSGDYTCFATSLIRHRIYNVSKTVRIEITGAVAMTRDAASTVGVVFGVIVLIVIRIYAAAFVLMYRKLTSLNGSVPLTANADTVSCRLQTIDRDERGNNSNRYHVLHD